MSIAENIANRKAAESLLQTMIDLAQPEFRKLADDAKPIFVRLAYERFKAKWESMQPPQPIASPEPKREPTKTTPADVDEALALCDEIGDAVECVSETGEEFAADVLESMEGVRQTIEETNRVTPKQLQALENWLAGLQRWIH